MTKPVKNELDELVLLSGLTSRVEPVLFGINLVLTVLASILVVRQRNAILPVMEEFDLQISRFAELALSPGAAAILPVLGVVGIAVHFSKLALKTKVRLHWAHFVIILVLTGGFVATTIPLLTKLIQQLE
ncbi:hypothetical protein KOR42_35300 [Thalassoglobus neptunius]|uniref:DUF5658 domain-containing protein n=1 Tax=Thalassoglobus neptunius TaxID=1938619 RepID=A0A5C5WP82_9PLAN|nr:hypothetical protein [Thalassoglobus neptunius]TWT51642.1 hypothetical protein KOR42_35300 [Thalassoglobus neptunius]